MGRVGLFVPTPKVRYLTARDRSGFCSEPRSFLSQFKLEKLVKAIKGSEG